MTKTQKLTRLAILAAIAYVATVVGRLPITAVEFLKYDPKDVILAITGFAFGPLPALSVTVVVSLIEMITVSTSGIIGFIMNVLSSAAFACTAAIFYKKVHNLKGAVVGLVVGTIVMTAVMLFWNYLITPLYMGVSREDVMAMLMPIFLPFNLIKGGLNTGITLLLYKSVRRFLHVKGTQSTKSGNSLPIMILGAIIVVTCTLFALVQVGIL